MKKYFTSALAAILFITLCIGQKTPKTPSPNFIIILADDLGYGDLGCFGSKIIKTPHLDNLAKTGLRLTQFYSGSTVCAPSRCTMLTGKHTGNAYIRGNGEIPLRANEVTLTKVLQQNGYNTALFGKWGLGDIGTNGTPDQQGWGTFFGLLHHVEAHNQAPGIAWRSSPQAPTPVRVPIEHSAFACDAFSHEAVEWIDKQDKNKPFFVELSLTLPHAELYVPKKAMQRYQTESGESIFKEKVFEGSHYASQTQPKATYAAMVSRMDDYVGDLVEILKAKGFDKNTIILFTSDNGTHIEGGRTMADVAFMNSSGPFKGIKRDLYEGGLRVPTIVWGHDLATDKVADGQGAFWDIMPTFLEMAGIKNKPDSDGISLYSYWKQQKPLPERPLYWEFFERGFDQALRLGTWKLIKRSVNNNKAELYNIENDISESDDLSAKFPEIVKKIENMMEKSHSNSNIWKQPTVSKY